MLDRVETVEGTTFKGWHTNTYYTVDGKRDWMFVETKTRSHKEIKGELYRIHKGQTVTDIEITNTRFYLSQFYHASVPVKIISTICPNRDNWTSDTITTADNVYREARKLHISGMEWDNAYEIAFDNPKHYIGIHTIKVS